MIRKIRPPQEGFSLVEVLVAIGILGVGGTAIVMMLGNSYQSGQAASDRSEAAFLASQSYEAVRSIGQDAYNRLVDGTYGLADSSGVWDFVATSDTLGRYTRQVVIQTARRDLNGNLSDTGSTDIHAKKITTALDWSYLNNNKTLEFVNYFTNWDSLDLWDDLVADYNGSTLDKTEITNWRNGEVALTAVGRILNPAVYFDASGNHDANAVAVQGTVAYVVRENNNSDTELVAVDVSDPENPSELGALELGDAVKDIAVSGDYAYLASIANGNEFMVIDIANPAAMFVAASLDLAKNADALSIEIYAHRAYVTRAGSSEPDVHIIDITTPTSPSEVGNFQIGANVYASAFDPEHDLLFIGAATNNSLEFHSLDVSSEASPVELDGLGLVGNQNILDMALDLENGIAYVGRYYTMGSQNIFAVDVSNPYDLSVMSSVSSGGHANSVIFNEEFLFVASNQTNAELAIIDLRDPYAMHVEDTLGINGEGLGIFLLDEVLYISTTNDSGELVIAKVYHGGEFETAGSYVSAILDAGRPANWNTIEWTQDLSCAGSDIQIQIRTADTAVNLASALWQGPDGKDDDETDFYTNPTGELLPTDHNGDQFMQYKVTLTGPGTCTPYLEDILITYTPY